MFGEWNIYKIFSLKTLCGNIQIKDNQCKLKQKRQKKFVWLTQRSAQIIVVWQEDDAVKSVTG